MMFIWPFGQFPAMLRSTIVLSCRKKHDDPIVFIWKLGVVSLAAPTFSRLVWSKSFSFSSTLDFLLVLIQLFGNSQKARKLIKQITRLWQPSAI
jgi:hypothetical protein